jgi:hypothetical protein
VYSQLVADAEVCRCFKGREATGQHAVFYAPPRACQGVTASTSASSWDSRQTATSSCSSQGLHSVRKRGAWERVGRPRSTRVRACCAACAARAHEAPSGGRATAAERRRRWYGEGDARARVHATYHAMRRRAQMGGIKVSAERHKSDCRSTVGKDQEGLRFCGLEGQRCMQ